MKRIFVLLFLFGTSLVWTQDTSADSVQDVAEVDISELEDTLSENCDSEEDENCESGENQILQFLIKDVIPSFEELKALRPSFALTLNNDGVVLNKCLLGLKLKQSKVINYILAEGGLSDFDAHMEIGHPLYVALDLSCEDYSFENSEQRFNLKVSIQDEQLNPSFYGVRVTSFDQEQVYVKLWSIDLEVVIQEELKEMGIDSEGFVQSLLDSSSAEDLGLTPLKVATSFQVNGTAELSLPTAVDGTREETPFTMTLNGVVYLSDTGEVVPVIDISME